MKRPADSAQATRSVLRHVLVVGAGGGIGGALVEALAASDEVERIFAAGRGLKQSPAAQRAARIESIPMDLTDEASIAAMARRCRSVDSLDLIIVATGFLHDRGLQPEKALEQVTASGMAHAFAINCTGPALVAKHCAPLLNRNRRSVFAALSARVGSIEDNRYGGWYSYRASKAALNMLIRTLAIELARRNPEAICLALHPGTVDTKLSAPFQSRVPSHRLFGTARAARQLLDVIAHADPGHSGRILAWDGSVIPS